MALIVSVCSDRERILLFCHSVKIKIKCNKDPSRYNNKTPLVSLLEIGNYFGSQMLFELSFSNICECLNISSLLGKILILTYLAEKTSS